MNKKSSNEKIKLSRRTVHTDLEKKHYWDFPHLMSGTNLLLETALDYGLDLGTCLSGTRIELQHIGRQDLLIEPQQEFKVIRNILAQTRCGIPLSLDIGRRTKIIRHSVLAITALNAKSFLDAFKIVMKFIHLNTAFCYMDPFIDVSGVYLKLENDTLPQDLKEFYVERDMAMLVKLQLELNPIELKPIHIQFSHSVPDADQQAYHDFFGLKVEFNATDNRMYIQPDALYSKLNTHDEQILNAGLEKLKQLKTQAKSQVSSLLSQNIDSYSHQIFQILHHHSDHNYAFDSIADHLNLHPRTLRRKLKLEDTSYAEILQKFQCHRAEILLKQKHLTLNIVADQLGYSELSAFSRAFKQWSGMSPHQYRKSEYCLTQESSDIIA